jgi:twitching motility protein PilT
MRMMDLTIDYSKKKKLFDVMAASGHSLRFLKGAEWASFDDSILTSTEIKNILFSFLTEEQKKRWEHQGTCEGLNLLKSGERILFNATESFGEIQLQLRIFSEKNMDPQDLGILEACEKMALKPGGLMLISGVSRSGKSSTLASLIQKAMNKKNIHATLFQDWDLFDFKAGNSTCSKREIEKMPTETPFSISNSQIIALDEGSHRVKQALDWALQGKMVFLVLPATSILQSLKYILNQFENSQRAQRADELSQVFIGGVNQRLVAAMGEGEQLVQEVVVGNQWIQQAIKEEKWNDFQKIIREGQEKYGMTTMNQSLLNLVMKRRIEIKTAFLTSPDLDDLDQMMKKVGI